TLSSSNTTIIEDTNTIQDIEVSDQEHWERVIENWFEMLETENYLPESEIVENFEFEFGGHDIHPADDSLAKWELFNLFNNSLEAPVFIDSMINFQ
ncbi:10575_t:CDS:1, partial [Ambispora gerdemannii]